MGLDMSLTGKEYLSREDRKNFNITGIKLPDFEITQIEFELAYWRKANPIHKWFVDNVQGGEDDCKEYYVNKEQLKELWLLCLKIKKEVILVQDGEKNENTLEDGKFVQKKVPNMVIVNSDICKKLLPSASGFFFGSTEYDSYYMDDINNTIEQLKKILNDGMKGIDIYYQSSW